VGRSDGVMEKKLHRILADAAVAVVRSVFEEGMVADRAVARALGAHPKWGKRDRSLVAETVYEVVRGRRRLEVLAGSGDWWALCGCWWESQGFARPEWATWPVVTPEEREAREAALAEMPQAVRFSLSDEFDAMGAAALGDCWEMELAALNQAAPVFLRVNPRRGNVASVLAELEAAGVEAVAVPGTDFGLQVTGSRAVPAMLRESGRFEIQDAASQQVAPFCQVEPGMRVVDACAGAGGKTLHLAALMEGKGDLLAMDVVERKLETLKNRAARATVKIRTALNDKGSRAAMAGQADRVLVDAPCSGSGTLRRQADLKYRITAESVAAVVAVQRTVLSEAAAMVKPGGKLVYATCSILPVENAEQAAWFTGAVPGFVFEEERRISPAETGWDGFYMARWRREG
jgi:16S rRNA (cytosine967-C5)-methyltransferase